MKMKPKSEDKYQKYKIASIPVLLIILGYVLLSPSDSSDTPPAIASAPATTPPAASTATTAIAPASAADGKKMKAWPAPDLDVLTGSNPFINYNYSPTPNPAPQLVSTSAESATAPSNTHATDLIRSLSETPVNYVFQSSQRKLVMLGDRIYEKGEQIDDSVQLIDIQGRSLILTVNSPQAVQATSQSLIQ